MSDGLFSVRRYFEKRHLNVTDEWINSCFDWCKNSQGLRETSKIIKACFDQWLITDLRVEGVQRCQRLIQDPRALKSQVPAGFYPIQVSYAVDIGTSCQTQLQRVNQSVHLDRQASQQFYHSLLGAQDQK